MYTQNELDNFIRQSINNLSFNKEPHNLYQPLEYIISIGGKRIRPRLCLTVFNLFNDHIDKSILNPALAIEIFHNFTLIHDDIMDKADTRRNMATVHKKWSENIAILSGDVMSILSYQYLAGYKGNRQNEVFTLFSTTAAQVCEGQQFDMEFEDLPFISMDEYLKMIGLKTAVLIACAAKIGAIVADAPENVCEALYDYAYKLGIAFQITDDYLDTFGDSSVFGKKIGNDIATNKKTWLLTECFHEASKEQIRTLSSLLKNKDDYSKEKYDGVVRIYNDLGLKEKALKEVANYEKMALESIKDAGFTEEQIQRLTDFARLLTYRES